MTTTSAEPASPSQIDYLRNLAARRAGFGPHVTAKDAVAQMNERIAAGLSSQDASDLISQFNNAPYWHDLKPAGKSLLDGLRRDAARKALYGLTVSPEDTLARLEARIAEGLTTAEARKISYDLYQAKPHPTAKSPLPLRNIEGIDDIEVSEGCYAVLVPSGKTSPVLHDPDASADTVLRFYRIYEPAAGEFSGEPVMRRYASDNLLALYPDEARTALLKIAEDPDAAAFRFADEHTRCFSCTRLLTDAVSRMISVGPDCRGFASHAGLRAAANGVDQHPERRHVYRALREWSLQKGFRDPRTKKEREAFGTRMTAARLAAAWSGLPGMTAYKPQDAVTLIEQALTGNEVPADLAQMLHEAPPDTVVDLTSSGILSAPVLTLLAEHPSKKVRDAAGKHLLRLLGA